MYITVGHFLEKYVVAVKDNKPISRLMALDTDLLVAQRVVGFNQITGEILTDLVKVDEVLFDTEQIPDALIDLLPKDFKKLSGRILIPNLDDFEQIEDLPPLELNLK